MKLSRIIELLQAETLVEPSDPLMEISDACGADLMSDVLRFSSGRGLLITGLTNVHALRTAEISGMSCIVFVSGKTPSSEIVEEADDLRITLLTTKYALFETCGLLYVNGLKNPPVPQFSP